MTCVINLDSIPMSKICTGVTTYIAEELILLCNDSQFFPLELLQDRSNHGDAGVV
jgi:hypothetical protein